LRGPEFTIDIFRVLGGDGMMGIMGIMGSMGSMGVMGSMGEIESGW